jgi:hypothetical protein
MGCDIHLHVEVKIEGKWEHYHAPNISRSYKLFEKMAGVRGEIKNAISSPKGLPDDLNIITRKSAEYWDVDGHSWSWLNLEEISILSDWLHDLGSKEEKGFLNCDLEHSILHCYCEGNSFAGIIKYPDEKPEWIEDVRFVFWFDN